MHTGDEAANVLKRKKQGGSANGLSRFRTDESGLETRAGLGRRCEATKLTQGSKRGCQGGRDPTSSESKHQAGHLLARVSSIILGGLYFARQKNNEAS